MKIIIADDDSLIADLLESQLTDWGYEPIVYTRSTEALAALTRDDAPQLAILDWDMPLIDGLSICRSVRKKKGNDTYIILLTGSCSSKQNVIQALQAGANDYIIKPFEPEDLKARIEAGIKVIKSRN